MQKSYFEAFRKNFEFGLYGILPKPLAEFLPTYYSCVSNNSTVNVHSHIHIQAYASYSRATK